MIHLQNPSYPFRVAICGVRLDARNTLAGEDLSGVDCQQCWKGLDARFDADRPAFSRHLTRLANFGEGSYGYVDWVVLGAVTCGLGLPVAWVGKRAAQGLLRLQGF